MAEPIEVMVARDENCPCWNAGDGAQIGHECAKDEALALLRQARPYVRIYPHTHELLAAIDAHLEGTERREDAKQEPAG